jgi:hypothetical protein
MRYLITFILSSFLLCAATFTSAEIKPVTLDLEKQIVVSKMSMDSINAELKSLQISAVPVTQKETPTDIIKYLLDLLGGLLTTVILYWLHKKFPDIFQSAKMRDYLQNKNE